MTQPAQQLTNSSPILNALSVDVEEYYHATIFQRATPGLKHDDLPSRVEPQVELLLDLLAQRRVHATFFTLGVVAEKHPLMLKRIAAAGHEIGCHGFYHDLVNRMTPAEFRADVSRTKSLLEDLSGQPVLGYRAPSFSITDNEPWALDILVELGFRYDSSRYPIRHDLYGDAHGIRTPHFIRSGPLGRLAEFPIGTLRIAHTNFPIGGGGYFRLLPLPVVRWGIRRVNRRERAGVIFYIHPWELDADAPRASMAWRHAFRLSVGQRTAKQRLATLLTDFEFVPIRELWMRFDEVSLTNVAATAPSVL